MNRMFAIVEREMRKFFRSPTLMIMSLMMPILQLLIMGNAFGGKITGARVAVVDYDHGPQAVKIREGFDSIAVNIRTFTTVDYTDENKAREDVRTGKVDAAVIIPAQYSRRVYAHDAPQIGFVVDNSDLFTSSSLEGEMQSLVTALTEYQGTLVFVSHDRQFLSALATRVLELTTGGAPHLYGGSYDEYVRSTGREAPGMRQ